MNSRSFKKLFSRPRLSILVGFVLMLGLFAVVMVAQQRQEIRSKAAGGTGVCNVDSNGNIVGNDCYMPSGFNGSIFGNGNTIGGGLGGSIFGDRNEIFGGLNGCINGNNNIIHGGVNGGVVGTGNIIEGGNNPNQACPDPRLVTPTVAPTAIPSPTQRPYGTCADLIDNNQNQLIDRADPICHTDGNKDNFFSYDPYRDEIAGPTSTPIPPTATPTTKPFGTCKDGIDNNQNELIDEGDPVCHTDGDQNNPNSYDPTRNEGPTPTNWPTQGPTATVAPTTIPTSIPTVVPGNTSFNLTLLLHGIGSAGDSANPQSGGNPNPLHTQRNVSVEVFNSQNALIITKTGNVNFQANGGKFTGTLDMGTVLTTGVYIVKVKSTQFLRVIVPGIQNITAGQVNQLPTTTLINGDIDGNNSLNILDYNILIGCYSDFSPAVDCSSSNKLLSDLDDDGAVNQYDYNLFLRELANRQGQ